MIDVAIIGSGAAGLSAAINCVARNRTAIVLGRKIETSMLYKAEKVENHLGMSGLTGKEMLESFLDHARRLQVEIKEGRVIQVLPMGKYFTLNFENEIFIEAKTVILATGVSKGKQITGESEYLGKGVSYCATCDGMLYRNKNVVLYSEIEEGIADANFLADICKTVTFVSKNKVQGNLKENIRIMEGKPVEVLGNDFVEAVKVNDDIIECDGTFFIKEAMPMDNLIPHLELQDNSVAVNRFMETNIKGVFACGDCTGWPYQVSNAIGEGLVAAQQADKFIREME